MGQTNSSIKEENDIERAIASREFVQEPKSVRNRRHWIAWIWIAVPFLVVLGIYIAIVLLF